MAKSAPAKPQPKPQPQPQPQPKPTPKPPTAEEIELRKRKALRAQRLVYISALNISGVKIYNHMFNTCLRAPRLSFYHFKCGS